MRATFRPLLALSAGIFMGATPALALALLGHVECCQRAAIAASIDVAHEIRLVGNRRHRRDAHGAAAGAFHEGIGPGRNFGRHCAISFPASADPYARPPAAPHGRSARAATAA